MKTFLVFFLWVLALRAAAISVDVHIGEARVQGVRGADVVLRLQSGADADWRRWSLVAEAPRLSYAGQVVRAPRLEAAFALREGGWQLDAATLRARFAGSRWVLAAESLALSRLLSGGDWASGLQLRFSADGDVLRAEWAEARGTMRARMSAAQLGRWLKALGLDWPAMEGALLADLQVWRAGGRWHLQGALDLREARWGSADGRYALEKAGGRLRFAAEGAGGRWSGDFDVALAGGEALLSPLYFDLRETPLSLSGRWSLGEGRLQLADVHFAEREAHGELAAVLSWPGMGLQRLTVHQASGDADAIYRRYARPFLLESVLGDAALSGTLFAGLDWAAGELREVSLVLNRVDVVDNQGRFALRGLDGQLGRGAVSRLRAAASSWHKLPIGAWEAVFLWADDGIRLQQPLRVPLLDGALVVERLEPVGLRDYRLDARIEPLDLRGFAEALDLPPFEGVVSGEFQQVRFNREGMRLLQPVLVRIFGGEVRVHDLRVEQPFSVQPLLYFGLAIDRVDLQRLARVLQVAEIRGNISGTVKDVLLQDWAVKRFAADIHTSRDEPGKRLISHEAVQYLSAAGGGSAVVGEFVRVLNAFPYARLGFVARLENNVLHMQGVEDAADGGYYLVKGSGLPRLDIIGYERRVDWPELLRRLDAARHTDEAVVE
ncbi:MAG: hypothetical protein Q4D61_04225 [Cardiobacteriaceae bacterium]|nr:hypothetical protein [Cardiobacteriaceae bacterium]